MNPLRLFAIVLIVAGALALAYGGFTYTREEHSTKLGPIELTLKDRERVSIPIWAGAAALIVGVGLLVIRVKR